MLHDFQLAAIAVERQQTRLLRIPLHQDLQNRLAEQWTEQYRAFIADAEEIEFNPGYQPEAHERFCIDNYELPDCIANENRLALDSLDSLTRNDDRLDLIKGVVAFVCTNEGEELLLFQNFNRSHVIHPGCFLFSQNNTYVTAESPGLTLDKKLACIYRQADQALVFQNFRVTNTFLPLAEFYQEASEQEIREILDHDLLVVEDTDALAENSNQWFRKRFAMLRDSEILDNYTAEQIYNHSVSFEVEVVVEDEKIVFPSDKREAKHLLQFLNEEIFRGAITERLYETNSKREADR
ncbi:hypothetical protein SAOR_02805 [Salinisphaera orenii MK-B5]|uniref:DUF4868 domain-containing protein n=1 Tax=Salinisphaera orenii MK-B5 TaxID=856730 RepID=A0A423PW04_9GAMM|nr:Kiwa anti-phage protein KwaB-like domain-containing protein [Salinisphaera orenii]ROO29759.1 hypothetical protein SAOR_02805 [Salinisphaera orenii MK-B5]